MKKTKFTKGELIKKLMLAMGLSAGVGLVMIAPPIAVTLKAILEAFEKRSWEKPSRSQLRTVLKKLKRTEIVTLKEEGDELVVHLTDNGRAVLMKYKFDEMKINKPTQWDKKWRVVSFDIPEEKKVARDVLRDKLMSLGFLRLQKSIFVYPYECRKEIELIKRVYEVEPFIYYFLADSLDNEGKLISHFKL